MKNYKFEAFGEITLRNENNNKGHPSNGNQQKNNIKLISYDFIKDNIYRITFITVYIINVILLIILPEESLLFEYIYRAHQALLITIILLATIDFFKIIRKRDIYDLILHFLINLFLIIIIILADIYVFEPVIINKLTCLKIIEPKDGDILYREENDIKVSVRKIITPIYVIVETPQKTNWVQLVRLMPHNKFKDILIFPTVLGQGYIAENQKFRIFAMATTMQLRYGDKLEWIPPDAKVSNVITVERMLKPLAE